MAEQLAAFLGALEPDVAKVVGSLFVAGYLSEWDPVTGENTVTTTGTQTLTNLIVLCDPDTLTANVRLVLIRTAGAPMILGRARKPPY
jgi:hypothetical protein